MEIERKNYIRELTELHIQHKKQLITIEAIKFMHHNDFSKKKKRKFPI